MIFNTQNLLNPREVLQSKNVRLKIKCLDFRIYYIKTCTTGQNFLAVYNNYYWAKDNFHKYYLLSLFIIVYKKNRNKR